MILPTCMQCCKLLNELSDENYQVVSHTWYTKASYYCDILEFSGYSFLAVVCAVATRTEEGTLLDGALILLIIPCYKV